MSNIDGFKVSLVQRQGIVLKNLNALSFYLKHYGKTMNMDGLFYQSERFKGMKVDDLLSKYSGLLKIRTRMCKDFW